MIFFRFTLLMATLSASSTLYAQEQESEINLQSDDANLIVYLTRTNNTKAVASMIHEAVGGELIELALESPYPEDYDAIVSQVDEENETGYLPPLESTIDNIEQYDTIFIGFPTWDMTLPPPMKSFLSEYDLSGKTVIPFNTNGGYGLGSSLEVVEELCAGCQILDAFETKGGLERDGILLAIENEREDEVEADVLDWLESIGYSGLK
ncbi:MULTISPECIES: flavodoxin [Halomonadaceae]|nr:MULTISPECIES: flavodoxin [Halomonas]